MLIFSDSLTGQNNMEQELISKEVISTPINSHFFQNNIWRKNNLSIRRFPKAISKFKVQEFNFQLDVSCLDNHPILQWKDVYHSSVDYFKIERSIDNKNWNFVAVVNSNEKSNFSNRNYYYKDISHKDELAYYRLVIHFLDNSTEVNKSVSISDCIESTSPLVVFPNPSNDGYFGLFFKSDKKLILSTTIYDSKYKKVFFVEGFQNQIDFSQKSNGAYFIQLKLKSGVITERVTINKPNSK